jgi:hypothetical protein
MAHIFRLSFRPGRIAQFGCSTECMLLLQSPTQPELEFHVEMAGQLHAPLGTPLDRVDLANIPFGSTAHSIIIT